MKKGDTKLLLLMVAFTVVAAVLIGGCAQQAQLPAPPAQPSAPPAPPELPQQNQQAANEKSVEITATGFSPNTLTIKAGDTVVFVNKDTTEHWPASAVHPTHAVYPGSDISKCGSAAAATIFDACKRLELGESFNFVFNEQGSWKYHDHLNPSLRGTIVVE